MKKEIDKIMAEILTSLKEEGEPLSQIDQLLKPLALKGVSRARQLRSVLEQYATDSSLSNEENDYARRQLERLPNF